MELEKETKKEKETAKEMGRGWIGEEGKRVHKSMQADADPEEREEVKRQECEGVRGGARNKAARETSPPQIFGVSEPAGFLAFQQAATGQLPRVLPSL